MNSNELLLTSSLNSQQCSVSLWDYDTLNVHKYYKNGGTVNAKCLEVVGQDYILSAELGKPYIHIWPLNSQDVAKNIRFIIPEPASCLALCPNSIYLAVGINCKLYVWQITSGKLLSVEQKNFQPITSIKFSGNGEYLLVGGQDGMLIVYVFGELISCSSNFLNQSNIGQVEPAYTKSDHVMPIWDIYVGNFERKSRFATVSTDQTCRIYNLVNGEPLITLVFGVMLTAVTFDGPCWKLFVGDKTGNINQFNLKNPPRTMMHYVDEANSSLTFKGHNRKIVCLEINISGTIIASGSEDNNVHLWDIKSRQILKKIEHKSSITNIKFVMGYSNFFTENLKPQIVLKNFERSVDLNMSFIVSQAQTYDIDLSDDENTLEREYLRQQLLKENVKLRAVNQQLYDTALKISKKYNMLNNKNI